MANLLLLLLCFLSLQPTSTFSKRCYSADGESLLKFKAAIKVDTADVLSSWNESIDCCQWNGVTCNSHTGKVTQLMLENSLDKPGEYMEGTLSPSLSELKSLRILSITGMKHLRGELFVLRHLTRLTTLVLESNALYGNLPSELPSRLSVVSLSSNAFCGSISSNFFRKSLVNLNLAGNFLSSSIPTTIDNLHKLEFLDLSSNSFSGSIPNKFSELQKLTYLDLSENSFSGKIPSSIFNATSLSYLGIANNRLVGGLSEEIGNLMNLSVLSLGFNQFTGIIPKNLSSLKSLWKLSLPANQFSGYLPIGFASGMPALSSIDLSYNHLEIRTFPNWLTQRVLAEIRFAGYGISGELPSFRMEALSVVDLSCNNFSTGIFKFFSNLTYLENVNLSNNLLNDNVSSLELPIQIASLDLHSNLLHGSLQGFINKMNMEFMETIDLSNNDLVGRIPVFSNATNLRDFNISNNNVAGPIPMSISVSRRLRIFDISKNRINGTIPPVMGVLSNLEWLDLSMNMLEGCVPKSLGRMRNLIHKNFSGNKLFCGNSCDKPCKV